jgi:hypothetical protein
MTFTHRVLAGLIGAMTASGAMSACGRQGTSTCPSGTKPMPFVNVGGEGKPDRSPVIDSAEPVTLLVRFTRPIPGGILPVTKSPFAVVADGSDPVLVGGVLGSANPRLEAAGTTLSRLKLPAGRYYLATGDLDGPIEVLKCS